MKKIWMLMSLGVMMATSPVLAVEKPLQVVATQTIYADLVRKVGGDRVKVEAIAAPQYNVHFIQPKPSDVRKVSKADLYVNAGLDLEAWSDPLLEAAGKPQLFRNAERNLDLSQGIPLLEIPDHPVTRAEGDIHLFGNPHFQMNPENARMMVQFISGKLKQIDPVHADYYQGNVDQFITRLDNKLAEWKALCAHCRGKEIISYHADIAYFADFLGLVEEKYLEPKPGIPPTPKHLQFLEKYIADHSIKAIVLPTYYSRKEAEKLTRRIGGKVVTILQGAGEIAGTEDFFSFFDYNFKQISEGLK